MHLSTILLAVFCALTCTSAALYENEKRQTTITNSEQFSSAASQLISLYIPSNVASALAQVASEAGSITTDVSAAVESALTATSAPPWLNAVPAEYSPNIQSLESAVSALRSYASEGSIPNAPYVTTTTNSAGSTVVITSIPASSGSATPTSGASGTATSVSTSTFVKVTRMPQVPAAIIDGLTQGSTASGSSTSTRVTTASPFSTQTATNLGGSSSSSSAFAVATQAPVVAGMGVLGLLGVIAAL